MSRARYFAANWKMNLLRAEAEAYLQTFGELITPLASAAKKQPAEVWFAPPVTVLETVARTTSIQSKDLGVPIRSGAQNCHWLKSGAHTGELSADMVRESGAQFVIVGHSERRQHYGETDQAVKRRAEAALQAGLSAIVCVGETREEFEAGRTADVIEKQLSGSFPEMPLSGTDDGLAGPRVLLAYEPVWAIGTGLAATPAIAEGVHSWIRSYIAQREGSLFAASLPILYGGSTTPENIVSLITQPNIDGGLVGGASLKPDIFAQLILKGTEA